MKLTVCRQKFVSLLGSSGCGKTTLLRIIAGLEAPSSGSLHFVDPALSRQKSFVFQDSNLLAWRTVRENIALPLELNRTPLLEQRGLVDAMIDTVRLGGFENSFPDELSGGMKMRVSLARALVTCPKLLLLDEPFASLDEMTRHALNEELLGLCQKSRTTVILITHHIHEALYLSDEILLLTPRPGRIFHRQAVDWPLPRDASLRHLADFMALGKDISEKLNNSKPFHAHADV